ncbi:MAG: FmdB family zinc ribbon protein [Myxococcota bacterium]
MTNYRGVPLYEYACDSCGSDFEIRQSIREDPRTDCPECGQDTLQRLVSRSNFALKGGGWYADGYGSKPEGKAEEKKGDAKDTKEPKDGKKTEESKAAKPETNKTPSEATKSESPKSDKQTRTGTDA